MAHAQIGSARAGGGGDAAARLKRTLAEIAALARPVLVATNEGTHGGPYDVRVYEDILGRHYYVHSLLGGAVGLPRSFSGTLRRIRHAPAAARRARIDAHAIFFPVYDPSPRLSAEVRAALARESGAGPVGLIRVSDMCRRCRSHATLHDRGRGGGARLGRVDFDGMFTLDALDGFDGFDGGGGDGQG